MNGQTDDDFMTAALVRMEDALGHRFQRPELLKTALTHSSYANEQGNENNERLEFLGDAVLELAVSRKIFLSFPRMREGRMTRLRASLVNEKHLAKLARKISLDQMVLLGKGEENQGGRKRDAVLCDALEAVLGALYLDAGFERACQCIEHLLPSQWPVNLADDESKDNKTLLQELTQARFKARPIYTLIRSIGPEHQATYVVEVLLPDKTRIQASASTVRKAEQQAAHKALSLLHNRH